MANKNIEPFKDVSASDIPQKTSTSLVWGQANNNPGPTRKKVLFVVTKSTLGGAQRYVYDLAVALPKDEYDVAVAFGGTGKPDSEPGILRDMLIGAGVRTIFLPQLGRDINPRADHAGYKALLRLFIEERPDIVHINSSKAGGLGALAARRAKVPRIIYTAHGWAFTERIPFPSKVLRLVLAWLTVILSHTVICVSESDRISMSHMPFTKKKLVVIHNGVKPVSELPRNAAREALFPADVVRTHQRDIWVVSVAELTANKNLFKAIEAVTLTNIPHKTQNIFYTIIGGGELHEPLEAYCQQVRTRNTVQLLDVVPDVRRYLKAFDVVFMPSLKEGLPYAILEAGAAELPVVASATGGIPEIIDDEKTGLLIKDPRATKKMAETLRKMLDADTRSMLGRLLKKRVETDFSFERMRAETFALYETPA